MSPPPNFRNVQKLKYGKAPSKGAHPSTMLTLSELHSI